MNIKLHASCDSQGRPLSLFLTAGQVIGHIDAPALVGDLPKVDWPLGDRGYYADRSTYPRLTDRSRSAKHLAVNGWGCHVVHVEELQSHREYVTLRSRPDLYGIETLSARYLRQTFKPHAHDEYLFGVIDGGVHAVWCRGETHQVPRGSVVTMRPGDIHHGGAGSETGWRQRMLYIPEAGMRALVEDITGRAPSGTLDFGTAFHARPDLAHRFSDLHEALHASDQRLCRDVALDALLGALLRELAPQIAPLERQGNGRIADAVDYLDAHVDEDISLDDLCRITGLRRRQTITAFRRATGLPPHAWHLQRKVLRVKHLLREGQSPAEAAAQTGFADQSHMGRHFRAIVGITPAAFARG